jgi:hypothetical protein
VILAESSVEPAASIVLDTYLPTAQLSGRADADAHEVTLTSQVVVASVKKESLAVAAVRVETLAREIVPLHPIQVVPLMHAPQPATHSEVYVA